MKPSTKLAQSLEILRELQRTGKYAIQSKDISRTHRERLIENGFLEESVKGWYIPVKPEDQERGSTAWYANFWNFCASYLTERFGNNWCLSPEQSLLIHAENWTVPQQLIVRSPNGTNRNMVLPHKTSLLQVRCKMPAPQDTEVKNNLRLFALAPAIIYCSPKFFSQHPTEARAILSMFNNASSILHYLLDNGHSWIAGRLIGAFKNIGRTQIANEIKTTMESAGYQMREEDPFNTIAPIDFSNKPPYCSRLEVMWHNMRQDIVDNFPKAKHKITNTEKYLESVEERYTFDAYHSLSMEGYQVSEELIEKVRMGKWNPDAFAEDRNLHNALAARGYWQSFKEVEKSIIKVLDGENPGEIIQNDHGCWYRELFQPSVIAGLLKPTDLAGYRRNPVYIRHSKHIPARAQIVSELMEEFFQLVIHEKNPAVRIVLGHFFFVYIHPYPDGNGRTGRFLMNVMMAFGNFPWTIIPVDKRSEYMKTLEQASVSQNIIPFCKFLAKCLFQ